MQCRRLGKVGENFLTHNLSISWESARREKWQIQEVRQLSHIFHSTLKIVSRQKFVSLEECRRVNPENPQSKHNPDSFTKCLSREREENILNCVFPVSMPIVCSIYLKMCLDDGKGLDHTFIVNVMNPRNAHYLCFNYFLSILTEI